MHIVEPPGVGGEEPNSGRCPPTDAISHPQERRLYIPSGILEGVLLAVKICLIGTERTSKCEGGARSCPTGIFPLSFCRQPIASSGRLTELQTVIPTHGVHRRIVRSREVAPTLLRHHSAPLSLCYQSVCQKEGRRHCHEMLVLVASPVAFAFRRTHQEGARFNQDERNPGLLILKPRRKATGMA